MNRLKKVKVTPRLPEAISGLAGLSRNLWWSWNSRAGDLFRSIDPERFERLNNNPVKLLDEVSQKRLNELAGDERYLDNYNKVMSEYDEYMNQEDTWFNKKFGEHKNKKIAYFCAEFGVHECVPIYSGGLGVLAGDHSKSASDLGLPFIGVGLLYRQGYFDQEIDFGGKQKNEFHTHDFDRMPISQVTDDRGNEIIIDVDIHDRKVYARVWKMQVGRIVIYLLDADFERNTPADREITYKLYGGDQEMRISQEILLGMGGVRLLNALDIKPYVYHMNEGHSVFLALERIRDLMNGSDLTFYQALEMVRSNTMFTTHTPVPAGNDAFPLALKDKYFRKYWESVGLSRQQFMDLGLQTMPEGFELFSLTILALKVAGRANGVSRLHGDVSSELWEEVWKDIPRHENPITYVTNGVHTLSWMAPEMQELFDRYVDPEWHYHITDRKMWEKVENIPDNELWKAHRKLKKDFIEFSRKHIKAQYRRNHLSLEEMRKVDTFMDCDALVIGFARRFATYKRATLIFRDIERLKKILNIPERKVHLVFSGKAHPADRGGQALIENIHQVAKEAGFEGKIFFLENYSLHISRYMVRGVDIWLNNPRRPLEASGTSGQKVPVNGGLNFSVLDGWWDEGFSGDNGWAINPDIITVSDDEEQAHIDSISLYDVLENSIVPMFYAVDHEGIPVKWVKWMKNSIKTVIPEFSTDNMVKNYTNKLYIPSLLSGEEYQADNFRVTKQVADKRYALMSAWSDVVVDEFSGMEDISDIRPGEKLTLSLKVRRGRIEFQNLDAELCIYDADEKPLNIIQMEKKENGDLTDFSLDYVWEESGEFYVGVRLIPVFDNMIHRLENGKAYWLS